MPFAPSPTDGSIPTDLVLLAAERAVTVTREEYHQDVLSGRTGRAVVELRPCPIASGKHAGQDGLEVALDGRRVGELTRMMAQRYRPVVDHLTAEGYRAGCEALLHDDARGTQVELRLTRWADYRRASDHPTSGPRADGPAAPGCRGDSDDGRSARRAAAEVTGTDDRHPAPPAPADGRDPDPARTRAAATVSPSAVGDGRSDRDSDCRGRPRQRLP
jgi:hypothetical protein